MKNNFKLLISDRRPSETSWWTSWPFEIKMLYHMQEWKQNSLISCLSSVVLVVLLVVHWFALMSLKRAHEAVNGIIIFTCIQQTVSAEGFRFLWFKFIKSWSAEPLSFGPGYTNQTKIINFNYMTNIHNQGDFNTYNNLANLTLISIFFLVFFWINFSCSPFSYKKSLYSHCEDERTVNSTLTEHITFILTKRKNYIIIHVYNLT